MTYVVVELCVDCKYTDCAAVCPVEAFHELTDRLYINADTCIDCDACVPECPVEAIFADTNVPENYAHWTQINIEEAPKYPIISQKIPALHPERSVPGGAPAQRLESYYFHVGIADLEPSEAHFELHSLADAEGNFCASGGRTPRGACLSGGSCRERKQQRSGR